MNYTKPYFLWLALALVLSSCVVLPNKEPFPEDVLTKLSSPKADKDLVRSLFGQPSSVKKGGKYWFYGAIRQVIGVLAGGGIIDDYEWLAVEFDDANKVKFYEFNDDNYGCLSNGICNLGGLIFGNVPEVVLTAPRLDDYHAKNYRVRKDECAVYFYQLPIFHFRSGNYPVNLIVDDVIEGSVNYESYLFFTHAPGKLSFKSYQFEIHTQCNAGEKLYLQVREGWFVKEGKDFAVVSSKLGQAEIEKRRLALAN